jgi:hypothetical protein
MRIPALLITLAMIRPASGRIEDTVPPPSDGRRLIVAKKTRSVDWGGGEFWDKDSVFRAEQFDPLPDNPLTADKKRFIRTDLGRANQLGDGIARPVVQVIAESTGEILYTVRAAGDTFTPRIYAPGKYTVKAGKDKPDAVVAKGVEAR